MNNIIFILNGLIIPLIIFFLSPEKQSHLYNILPLLSVIVILYSLKITNTFLAIFCAFTTLILTAFYFPIYSAIIFIIYLILLVIQTEIIGGTNEKDCIDS